LKINKYVLLITTLIVYIMVGFIPSFRIKLAPLVEMSQLDGKIYYFYENFIHNWEFKLVISLIIVTILGILLSKNKLI